MLRHAIFLACFLGSATLGFGQASSTVQSSSPNLESPFPEAPEPIGPQTTPAHTAAAIDKTAQESPAQDLGSGSQPLIVLPALPETAGNAKEEKDDD